MAANYDVCHTLADLLDGDGRRKVWPGPVMAEAYAMVYGCRPMLATRGQARMIRDQLERFGISNHSATGNVLWVTLEICRHMGYAYAVEVHRAATGEPIAGYTVKLSRG